MGIPRTVIPSSGAVSFGDINAAIEWSFSRSNTYMRGDGGFQDGSLIASWNATLIAFVYIDYASDNGYTSFTLLADQASYETLPDFEVDVNVYIDLDVYYYDAGTNSSYSMGNSWFTVYWPNTNFAAGASSTYTVINYYDMAGWGGYGGVGSFSFVNSIVSITPTSSGTEVDESAGFGVAEFRDKSRYRGYTASITCFQC
jgi:hypothetical protein